MADGADGTRACRPAKPAPVSRRSSPNFYCYVPPNTVGASSCRRAFPGMCRVTSSEKLGTLYEAGTGQEWEEKRSKEGPEAQKHLSLSLSSPPRTGQDRTEEKRSRAMSCRPIILQFPVLPCCPASVPSQGFLVVMQVHISITVCPVFHLSRGGWVAIWHYITNITTCQNTAQLACLARSTLTTARAPLPVLPPRCSIHG